MKRAGKKTPLLLSALSGSGVIEAKRALLEIIDSSGGTTAARRRAEAPALAAIAALLLALPITG